MCPNGEDEVISLQVVTMNTSSLIGIKRQVVDMLLSYNPLWLRIGLEVRQHYQFLSFFHQLRTVFFSFLCHWHNFFASLLSDHIW